jgi:UDPglucose--hexose-1-phosphate uridylyltransferase
VKNGIILKSIISPFPRNKNEAFLSPKCHLKQRFCFNFLIRHFAFASSNQSRQDPLTMPELRRDMLTGRWVVFSPQRKQRPLDFPPLSLSAMQNSFCGGQEHLTPPEVYAVRSPGSPANGPGWRVRVVPNRFPALRIEGDLNREGFGFYDRMNGVGAHEVIIETPEAKLQLEDLPVDHVADILRAYRARTRDLQQDQRFRTIILFKNHGPLAGATLAHAHSQLVAMPIVPPALQVKLNAAQEYFDHKERCLFEDLLRSEQNDGSRMVLENSGFALFCPYASRFPFELCLVPKRQSPDFQSCSDAELGLLAEVLSTALRSLARGLSRPCYNLVLHSAPLRGGRHEVSATMPQEFRWHLEILPRLSGIAGFEMHTGCYINTTLPEEAAAFLREVKLS